MTTRRTSVNLDIKQINFLKNFSHEYWKKFGKPTSSSAVLRALVEHLSSLEKDYQFLLIGSLLEDDENDGK